MWIGLVAFVVGLLLGRFGGRRDVRRAYLAGYEDGQGNATRFFAERP